MSVKALSAICILQYGFYSGNDKNIHITVPLVIFGQEHLFLNKIWFNYTTNWLYSTKWYNDYKWLEI